MSALESIKTTSQKPSTVQVQPTNKSGVGPDIPKHKVKPTKPPSALVKYAGIILLGLLDLVALVSIFWITTKLPSTAREFNKLRVASEQATIKDATEIAKAELAALDKDTSELKSYYPNESGLVGFVQAMEGLKQNSLVGYSFANKEPVKDATGTLAVPIILNFTGTWTQIDADLVTIQELPYLIRFVDIDSRQDPETNVVDLSLGGFIYVSQDFTKN